MMRRAVWGVACVLALLAPRGVRAGDKYFDADGVKIRYTDQGRGEPVVLVHGFGANIEDQWDLPGVIKALAKDYRAAARHAPGAAADGHVGRRRPGPRRRPAGAPVRGDAGRFARKGQGDRP